MSNHGEAPDPENPFAIPAFTKEDSKCGSFFETSTFSVLFPRYREQYLQSVWPKVKAVAAEHKLEVMLDLVDGSMKISTTKDTWDPYAIIKGRDFIKLLSRSVDVARAAKVMEDGVFSEVIKIGSMVRNKDRFIRRRQRLLGPDNVTLKSLELLTKCYIHVQGNTVSVVGPIKGMKVARKAITDCMNNIHPLYRIKELMLMKELEKDDELRTDNWKRFLPKHSRKKTKERKKVIKKKKEYNPFPNLPVDSKVDKAIASGEYFLSSKTSKKDVGKDLGRQELQEKRARQSKNKAAKAAARASKDKAELYTAPSEAAHVRKSHTKTAKDTAEGLKKKFLGAKPLAKRTPK